MGCSNPHPHGQIWASDFVPNEPAKEDRQQLAHLHQHGSPLLLDYLKLEMEQNERIVVQNDDWVALVPYWAKHLGKTSLKAHQLSRRGGLLHCALKGERVDIGGQAVTFLVGHIEL